MEGLRLDLKSLTLGEREVISLNCLGLKFQRELGLPIEGSLIKQIAVTSRLSKCVNYLPIPLHSSLNVCRALDGIIDHIKIFSHPVFLSAYPREIVALESLIVFRHRDNNLRLQNTDDLHLNIGTQAFNPTASVHNEHFLLI